MIAHGKILAATFLAFASALAALPCDGKSIVKTNPVTGNEERVCVAWDGHDYEIEWSEKTTGWSEPVRLTDNRADDVVPDLAFGADGRTGVVWRRSGSTGRVMYIERIREDGAASWRPSATTFSAGIGDASAPRIVYDDSGDPWVGWHEYETGGSITVMGGHGDGQGPWPMPFSASPAGPTDGGGDIELDMNAEGGEKWLVWIESGSHLAYSVWSDASDGWGPTLLEPYDGPSDVDAGKERVRQRVLP